MPTNRARNDAPSNEDARSKAIVLLEQLDFDRKYYAFVESTMSRKIALSWNQGEWRTALESLGLTYEVSLREKFFRIEEVRGNCRMQLTLAYSNGALEPILNILAPFRFSSPFPVIAYAISDRRIGAMLPDPPYPKIRYENAEQLQTAIAFSLSLFQEAADAICQTNSSE